MQSIEKKKIEDVDKKTLTLLHQQKNTDYNTKITEIKNKMPSVTGLVATVALNAKATENEKKDNWYQ